MTQSPNTPITRMRALPSVRRAWPHKDGGVVYEKRDQRGRIRAGRIDQEGRVSLAEFALDNKLPELTAQAEGQLVSHRFNKRAVSVGRERTTKFVRASRAEMIAERSAYARSLCLRAGLEAPEVIGHTGASVQFRTVGGTTLHDRGSACVSDWQRFARAWVRFTQLDSDTQNSELAPHTGADEAAVVHQWITWATRYGSLDRIEELTVAAQHIEAALRDEMVGPERLVPAHRDLHDKQILVQPSRITLLDFDTLSAAEPELDVANLRVHAELRHVQGTIDRAALQQIRTILEAISEEMGLDEHRLAIYLAATRIRLACVYSFRPQAEPWLGAWLNTILPHTESHQGATS